MHRVDNEQPRRWYAQVLSDVHLWVPLIVLLGGLILLKSIN